ncbi:MAG TPA: EamA family transporter [Methanothermococcus okinawensis]|uniref:EamA family transporter n=1 Tax=Methanothermococcus okinawensis TaxID=155863 RepID=A0A832ZKL5_9EURY|nr:EamA family transporter [Methanococcaceae archaeon]HIP84919.1 EamA family transporter [Methanothermococcus okinawensis]HIP91166.1 EamA family transporter [Methanothermococcus okinawensis]
MKGEVLALIIAVMWGIFPIIEKKALNYIDPSTALFLIVSMNFLVISSLYILLGKISIESLKSLPLKPVLFLAVVSLGSVLSTYLYYKALKLSSPSKIVLITSIYPFFTIIANSVITRELPSIKILLGALFIFLGIYLVMDYL